MLAGHGITNREIATGVWLAIFIAWALSRTDIRRSIVNLVRVFTRRMILLSLALIAVYVYAETRILSSIGMWDGSHTKETIIWSMTVAVVMFVDITNIREDKQFFRKAALSNFNASVVLSFLVNLYSFHLLIELALVPLLAFLLMLQAYVQIKDEYKILRGPIDSFLAAIGVAVLLNVGYSIYSDFSGLANLKTAKDLAVPPALSLLFLPLIYLFLLLIRYESLFARLDYYVADERLRRYVKFRLMWTYGVSIWRLNRWGAALPSFDLRAKTDVLDSLRERELPGNEPPRGFRSLPWGTAPLKSMKKFSGPTNEGLSIYAPLSDKIPLLLGVQVTGEMYSFSHDKLYSASSWFEGTDTFEKMRMALSRAYGPPSFFNDKMPLLKWKWPPNQVEIHLYFEKQFSRTTVTFLNNVI